MAALGIDSEGGPEYTAVPSRASCLLTMSGSWNDTRRVDREGGGEGAGGRTVLYVGTRGGEEDTRLSIGDCRPLSLAFPVEDRLLDLRLRGKYRYSRPSAVVIVFDIDDGRPESGRLSTTRAASVFLSSTYLHSP